MVWQDILIALSTLTLNAFLIPTILNRKTYIPQYTSGAFVVAIAGIALGLFSNDLFLGALLNAIGAFEWVLVFFLRGRRDGIS